MKTYSLIYYTTLLFLPLFINIESKCQTRQSDSMRLKQLEYYNRKIAEADKAKAEQRRREQEAKNPAVVTYDSRGNKIESTIKPNGDKVVTTTIKLPSPLNRPFNPDTIDKEQIVIKVYKSKYRLNVYHKGNLLTAYKCVFGPNCTQQKLQEGDRRTPEGTFTITDVRNHDKWQKFMLFDYPNEESRRNHEIAKENGLIPASARIGGMVGIHGIWQNGDNVIDMKHNWTDGCVAIKNKDVEELSKVIKPGITKIIIMP